MVYAVRLRIYWLFQCGFNLCTDDGKWCEGIAPVFAAGISTMYLLHPGGVFAAVVDACEGKAVYAFFCPFFVWTGLCGKLAGKFYKSVVSDVVLSI